MFPLCKNRIPEPLSLVGPLGIILIFPPVTVPLGGFRPRVGNVGPGVPMSCRV